VRYIKITTLSSKFVETANMGGIFKGTPHSTNCLSVGESSESKEGKHLALSIGSVMTGGGVLGMERV